jgi:kynurenine formamidase
MFWPEKFKGGVAVCEGTETRGLGWQGWMELPERTPAYTPSGPWIDLTYRLSSAVPCAGVFPEPVFRRVRSLPKDPINVTEMQMIVHIGTHVDAPRHFFRDGPAFHEIPLERLTGPGVVLHVDKPADGIITPADLAENAQTVRRGDIVIVDTGWAKYADTHQYHDHPYLSAEAAQWLVDRGAKLVAFDLPTPDLPVQRRDPAYNWPAHHVLLRHGVLISENVRGTAALVGQRAEFMFLALNIEDSDGAPARVVGRPISDAPGRG